jgi:DNA-binding transcriptional MerR regulator
VNDPATYSIEELADAAGVSRRTVRYYVQRGLLPPPTGLGRGRHYTSTHLRQLLWVRDEQAGGTALEAIAQKLAGTPEQAAPPSARAEAPCELWSRHVFKEGVELHVQSGALPSHVERALRAAITAIIGGEGT